MKSRTTRLAAMVVAALAVAVACWGQSPRDPALSKQRYDAVVGHLDTGGDLLIVANLDGWVKECVEGLTAAMTAIPASGSGDEAALQAVGKIPAFLDRSGFYAVQGFGMSVVPRADGLNTLKVFVARDPAAAGLPLWRAAVGGTPRRLECADFLPADTVLARTGTGELKQWWAMLRAGVAEVGTPQAAAGFDAWAARMAATNGVDIERILESFTGEGFFSVQLSRTATITMPQGPEQPPLRVPQPALLIGMAVQGPALAAALDASFARAQLPVTVTEGDVPIKSVQVPMPLPFPFTPAYTVYSNFFLFGSTPEVVAGAIRDRKAHTGLVSTPEYQQAFRGAPVTNNGVFYMSPRLMAAVAELQGAAAGAQGPAGGAKAPMNDAMRRMLKGGEMQSALVFLNLPDGVLASGVSSSSGREIIGSATLAPVGLLAAIAVPSFIKARSTSRMNACINNLRQIEGAKEQWALEQNKAEGDEVDVGQIVQFIRGNQLPACPQGGVYTVNVIGTDARCSIPGHSLEGR